MKPFHHDAAAIKEVKAEPSNLTVAVSFGLEREAAFEQVKTKTVVWCLWRLPMALLMFSPVTLT